MVLIQAVFKDLRLCKFSSLYCLKAYCFCHYDKWVSQNYFFKNCWLSHLSKYINQATTQLFAVSLVLFPSTFSLLCFICPYCSISKIREVLGIILRQGQWTKTPVAFKGAVTSLLPQSLVGVFLRGEGGRKGEEGNFKYLTELSMQFHKVHCSVRFDKVNCHAIVAASGRHAIDSGGDCWSQSFSMRQKEEI